MDLRRDCLSPFDTIVIGGGYDWPKAHRNVERSITRMNRWELPLKRCVGTYVVLFKYEIEALKTELSHRVHWVAADVLFYFFALPSFDLRFIGSVVLVTTGFSVFVS